MKKGEKKESKRRLIEIDAGGKILGRLATKVAGLLRGKDDVNFVPNKESDVFIIVYNLEKIKVTGGKADKKVYWYHTSYPGGIKSIKYKDLFKKDPTKVFYKAVYGMLPKNKLRARMLRRLKLYKGEIE